MQKVVTESDLNRPEARRLEFEIAALWSGDKNPVRLSVQPGCGLPVPRQAYEVVRASHSQACARIEAAIDLSATLTAQAQRSRK
jgi:hypothetical protein